VKLRLVGAALSALTLAACATAPTGPPPGPAPGLGRLPLAALPGWSNDDHAQAFAAYRATCQVAKDATLARICREAQATGVLDETAARSFFEARFEAQPVAGAGVLTGYYAPVYEARRAPDALFSAPLRGKPEDLGRLQPYPDRSTIEASEPAVALGWLKPEDLFFLQIQGSGALVFEDGARLKALYAANNGRPYVAIAGPMRERGLLPADQSSAEAIHGWLAAHRGPEAQAMMQLNPRYAFFRLAPDDGRPPVGAAGVPLPRGRAAAVDLAAHAAGDLLWIDADRPLLAGAPPRYQRLAVALDSGGAIRGPVRADLYVGEGEAAGAEAGRIRHELRLFRLVPREAP
jgi:membrane-bound lytic murein transglycosylase A